MLIYSVFRDVVFHEHLDQVVICSLWNTTNIFKQGTFCKRPVFSSVDLNTHSVQPSLDPLTVESKISMNHNGPGHHDGVSVFSSQHYCFSVAFQLLLNKGGWVDSDMNIGVEGMMEIIRRRFEGHCNDQHHDHDHDEYEGYVPPWRLNIEGNLENDIADRQVEKLPNYTYRDDAMKVYKIIKKYVTTNVKDTYEGNIIYKAHFSVINICSCLLLFYHVRSEKLKRNDFVNNIHVKIRIINLWILNIYTPQDREFELQEKQSFTILFCNGINCDIVCVVTTVVVT